MEVPVAYFLINTLKIILEVFSGIAFVVSLIIFIIFVVEAFILLNSRRHTVTVHDNVDIFDHSHHPYIYVLIPCLNEDIVICSTLNAFLSYKGDRIKFFVIDDDSDDLTREKVREFNDKRLILLERKLPIAQNGKGNVLNFALEKVIEDADTQSLDHQDVVVIVMDADTYIDDTYFDKIKAMFGNRKITGVQSKVKIVPNTMSPFDLTHIQDLEFSIILNFMQSLRAKNGNAALGGNGQVMRLSFLELLKDEGPWNDSLVEDFDLSLRLTLQGVKPIVHVSDLVVYQSGLSQIGRLISQRTRWAQGNMQCSKYIPKIIKSNEINFKAKFEMTYFLFKPWLVLFEFLIIIVVIVQVITYGMPKYSIVPLWLSILMIFSLFIVNFFWSLFYLIDREIQRDTVTKTSKFYIILLNGLLLSVFEIILNFAFIRAAARFITQKKNWDKTERN